MTVIRWQLVKSFAVLLTACMGFKKKVIRSAKLAVWQRRPECQICGLALRSD
ncbi:Uncharacterized protein dnm_001040 [Desulfonema magnum]|uniref:Uncharacterized protein n=1 Tax=Desulfonema magnum TaxID=45655 RepID=A0A975BEX5_9BACT|nr:Uncharacterized protein dnm_001040 [Desulfonema magnum]